MDLQRQRDLDESAGDDEDTGPETLVDEDTVTEVKQIRQMIRIATIDNFQGEESKVVLISMTRSNPKKDIGFIKSTNRATVLLSRAQWGMYIFGNASMFRDKDSTVWPEVIGKLEAVYNIGPSLRLRCFRHQDFESLITHPEDFDFVREGGCNRSCEARKSCGHSCDRTCHPDDPLHSLPCTKPCTKLLTCGHACRRRCGDECGDCHEVIAQKDLPCGHIALNQPCYLTSEERIGEIRCEVKVEVTVRGCEHVPEVTCAEATKLRADPRLCKATCSSALPCGHECTKRCGACLDANGQRTSHGRCAKTCDRPAAICRHPCLQSCHAAPGEDGCPPCQYSCETRCNHSRCRKLCSDPCDPCAEECTNFCPHGACPLPCGAPCSLLPCDERCTRYLTCGCRCPSLCCEPCPSSAYCPNCSISPMKDQVVDLVCFTTLGDVNPDVDPILILPCGHCYCVSTLDQHMELDKFFKCKRDNLGEVEEWLEPLPLEGATMGEVKTCPDCRAPIASAGLRRYNRPLKKAALDRSELSHVPKIRRQRLALLAAAASDAAKEKRGDLKRVEQKLKKLLKMSQAPPALRVYEAIAVMRQTRECQGEIEGQSCWEAFDMPHPDMREEGEILIAMGKVKELKLAKEEAAGMDPKGTDGILLGKFLTRELDAGVKVLAKAVDSAKAARAPRVEAKAEMTAARLLLRGVNCFIAYWNSMDGKGRGASATQVFGSIESLKHKGTELARDGIKACEAVLRHTLPSIKGAFRDDAVQTRELLAEAEARLNTMMSGQQLEALLTGDGNLRREMNVTRWYQCRNGHMYGVGDCGQLNQSSTCPDCGERIGGATFA
ncbi:unnamed protein product [Chrysoparadoxa australica]